MYIKGIELESPAIDPYIHGQLIFDKEAEVIQCGKYSLQ